jgi:hypothetical protein
MIDELSDGSESFLTGRTSRHHNPATALRNRWRLVNECGQIVALDFFLQFAK